MEPLTDPKEVRKLLDRVEYGRASISGEDNDGFGKYSYCSALVNRIKNAARHQGWSGEDTMTMLAYHALLAHERTMQELIDWVNLTPQQSIIKPTHAP